jgi:hypothetical protein
MWRFSIRVLCIPAICLMGESAHAFSEYQSQIPSRPAGCGTCHVDGGGSPRNPFGLDVEATLDRTVDGIFVQWSELWNVDSDGDGQSNGMELGDPCGEWSTGSAPRTTDLSSPGDEHDASIDPDTGCLGDASPPASRTPRPSHDALGIRTDVAADTSLFDVGGCFGNQNNNGPHPSYWILFSLIGGIGLWRRQF